MRKKTVPKRMFIFYGPDRNGLIAYGNRIRDSLSGIKTYHVAFEESLRWTLDEADSDSTVGHIDTVILEMESLTAHLYNIIEQYKALRQTDYHYFGKLEQGTYVPQGTWVHALHDLGSSY